MLQWTCILGSLVLVACIYLLGNDYYPALDLDEQGMSQVIHSRVFGPSGSENLWTGMQIPAKGSAFFPFIYSCSLRQSFHDVFGLVCSPRNIRCFSALLMFASCAFLAVAVSNFRAAAFPFVFLGLACQPALVFAARTFRPESEVLFLCSVAVLAVSISNSFSQSPQFGLHFLAGAAVVMASTSHPLATLVAVGFFLYFAILLPVSIFKRPFQYRLAGFLGGVALAAVAGAIAIASRWAEFADWTAHLSTREDNAAVRLAAMKYEFPLLFGTGSLFLAKTIAFFLQSFWYGVTSYPMRACLGIASVCLITTGILFILANIKKLFLYPNFLLFASLFLATCAFVLAYPVSSENYGVYAVLLLMAPLAVLSGVGRQGTRDWPLLVVGFYGIVVAAIAGANLYSALQGVYSSDKAIAFTQVFQVMRRQGDGVLGEIKTTYTEIKSWPAAKGVIRSLNHALLDGNLSPESDRALVYRPEEVQRHVEEWCGESAVKQEIVKNNLHILNNRLALRGVLFRSDAGGLPLVVYAAQQSRDPLHFTDIGSGKSRAYTGVPLDTHAYRGMQTRKAVYAINDLIPDVTSEEKSQIFGAQFYFLPPSDAPKAGPPPFPPTLSCYELTALSYTNR